MLLPLLPLSFSDRGKGAREERKPQQNLKIKKNMCSSSSVVSFFFFQKLLSLSLSFSPKPAPSTRAATRFPRRRP